MQLLGKENETTFERF